ncbi:hypothetical protein TCAL_08141 [Tigriopus californicus]|uniref:Uncharacterized protein n=1 Tax=Tigriopus californicus TaxID=6832 RepID=A0A553PLM7_TIGCA|nr:germinal-center associated nuclear protein-like [Tigriopus californicus]TRY78583.1 hypothetical protein TCAL_08141 [Tigriopus californicus]|eukprot:TCALIF_08141-PA protein Name:"Similar to Mcm3ap Germinal-center associated nuclear protein (Mus musculus)" AED:0.07 eAED:0.09 QI:0/-1/0/1/-1/1/1/0/1400
MNFFFGSPASDPPPPTVAPSSSIASVPPNPFQAAPSLFAPPPPLPPPPAYGTAVGKANAPAPSSTPLASHDSSERDLVALLQSQTFTEQDRFNVLDARDKLMRVRGQDRHLGTVLRGTCPDICPEKERYSRAVKNQLRSYEKLEGRLNHKAAVKEYSRSSADQEIPLAHDLRPSAVLDRSMNHILANIIDRVENQCGTIGEWYGHVEHGRALSPGVPENMGDWFEFVWSITRGIRKDITQQMLRDVLAVNLVEKCARLHIMCSERLIEESSHNFDRKLNDENLTKCLQTLKHMYEDCTLDGVRCAHEPEFRAYEVLMNLNHGDTLRHVQNLDSWVRQSPEILFVVKVFMALSSNNYIKFFKLVRKATLLQGCILLRYFYQVRFRALRTILKAFCPNMKSEVNFSLTKLTSLLGFEDVQECMFFCQWHGLTSEVNEDRIVLDRQKFIIPDELPVVKRARNLIECKRLCPWSQVINNEPLGPNPYLSYRPHDSFDAQGFLKEEAWQALDQRPRQISLSPEETQRMARKRMRDLQIQVLSQETAQDIIEDVMVDEMKRVAEFGMEHLKRLEVCEVVAKETMNGLIQSNINLVSSEALREKRNDELQQRLIKEARTMDEEELAQETLDKLVDELSADVVHEAIIVVEKDEKVQKFVSNAHDLIDDLCQEVVKEFAQKIAKEQSGRAEEERSEAIESMKNRGVARMKAKFFTNWRIWARRRMKRAQILKHFPCKPSDFTLKEQLNLLGPSRRVQNAIEGYARQSLTSNLLRAQDIEDQLLRTLILEPVDLVNILGPKLTQLHQKKLNLVWKGVLCTPLLDPDSTNWIFLEMVKKKLSRNPKQDVLANFSAEFGFCQCLSLCIRHVNSETLDDTITMSEHQRREYLNGTSGIVFLDLSADETLERAMLRLKLIIEQLPQIPKVPVAVITDRKQDNYDGEMGLISLKKEGKISFFHVIHTSSNIFHFESPRSVDQAIRHLSEFIPEMCLQDLTFQPLKDLVEDFVCAQVIVPMYQNQNDRKRKDLPHQEPNLLMSLFNSALDHLVRSLCQLELTEISWPPPEIHNSFEQPIPSYWNDSIYIDAISQTLKALRLPEIRISDVALSWEERCHEIYSYVQKQAPPSGLTASHSVLKRRLLRHYRQFHFENIEAFEFGPDLMPWVEVVHTLIQLQLSKLDLSDPFDQTKDSEAVVGLFKTDVNEFQPPKSWTASLGFVPENKGQTVQDQVNQSLSRAVNESLSGLSATLSNDKLHRSIHEELENSSLFETKLKEAMNPRKRPMELHETLDQVQDTLTKDPRMNSTRPRYEPVVAYLSPSLGQRATALNRWTRVDSDGVESSVGLKSPQSAKKRRNLFQEQCSESPEVLSSSSQSKRPYKDSIRNLQDKIEQDLNASYDFEQRLQAALNHSK